MPAFDIKFSAEAQIASEIVRAGELSRASGRDEWTLKRIEFLHELAYLRVFVAWETLLESIFYRTLCGYASKGAGQESPTCGFYYSTIAAAEAAVLGSKPYILWQNTATIIKRCNNHIGSPGSAGLQETVIASNAARLDHFAAIRHRIVHDQKNAKTKFDNAAIMLAGKTYPASRPGKFLRSVVPGSPTRKWLDVAVAEFVGMAGQMV